MISHRLLTSIGLALLPLTATAIPVTYEFSGQVGFFQYETPPDMSFLDPFIPFGSEFNGSFTYENETPFSFQGTNFVSYPNPITAATISFGPGGSLGEFNFVNQPYAPYTSQSSSIQFVNDLELAANPPYDQFNLVAAMGNAPGDPSNMYRTLSFSISDYSAQAIPPGQTLLDPLPVDAFFATNHQLSFGFSLVDEAGNQFGDQSLGSQQIKLALVPTSVPEPGTLPLLGVSLAGLLLAMSRRLRPAQSAT